MCGQIATMRAVRVNQNNKAVAGQLNNKLKLTTKLCKVERIILCRFIAMSDFHSVTLIMDNIVILPFNNTIRFSNKDERITNFIALFALSQSNVLSKPRVF